MPCLLAVFHLCRALLASRVGLAAENIALRHQIAVLRRRVPRPRLRPGDRLVWVGLSRWFGAWRSWLAVVKPDTVVGWHRQGFRLYWRWKSRGGKPGRPAVSAAVRRLIRQMGTENLTWGAPRIRAELRLLGHDVAVSTVAKYQQRPRQPPSQSWRTFLANHTNDLASMDFFTVPTASFRLLFVFVILRHDRRRVVHCNVTSHPTAAWVARPIRQAFPFDTTPRFLLRDRDAIYGTEVGDAIRSLGIEAVVTAPRSPWQNPFVERLIGTIRRECLDHVIVLNEAHLKRILSCFWDYYHASRCHTARGDNAPLPREVQPPARGKVVGVPLVGGLQHRYCRCG